MSVGGLPIRGDKLSCYTFSSTCTCTCQKHLTFVSNELQHLTFCSYSTYVKDTFILLVYKGSKLIHLNGIVYVYEYIYVSVCERCFAVA